MPFPDSLPGVRELDMSDHSLRMLLDAMPDPPLLVNRLGEIIFAGNQFAEIVGWTPGELVGAPVERLLPDRYRDSHQAHRDNFFSDPAARPMGAGLELFMRHKNGCEIPVEVSLSPLETEDDVVVLCIVRDQTAHHRLLQSLVAEKSFSDGLFENAPAIILLLDPVGRIVKMNRYLEQISGFRSEDVVGESWFKTFLPEGDETPIRNLFQDVIATGGHAGHVNAILTRNGTLRQIDWFAKTLKDGHGQPIGLLNVGYDITERIEQDEKLEQAQRSAERANAAKSKFLAAASHDLRQPLQSAGMYLTVLDRQIEGAGQKEIVGKLRSSLEMMGELLNALLDISKLDSGSIVPEERDFNVRELLERVVIDNLPSATEKGLRLNCEVQDHIVHSDPALLARIIENIVTNAIRYTNEGEVTMECLVSGDSVRIAVTDTGIGIPSEALDKLFDEYFQLDNNTRDQRQGLGLGLSIVKQIAQVLGHPIGVSSKPGAGSTFSVLVPLGKAGALTVTDNLGEETSKAGRPRPVVLLVDDDPAIVDAAGMLLESAGIDVISASGGYEAIMRAEKEVHADVVITDYRLPSYDGIELIRRLRRVVGWPIPAVVMTGDTSAIEIERANLLNCTVLRKPIDTGRLIDLVETLTATSANRPASGQQLQPDPQETAAVPLVPRSPTTFPRHTKKPVLHLVKASGAIVSERSASEDDRAG